VANTVRYEADKPLTSIYGLAAATTVEQIIFELVFMYLSALKEAGSEIYVINIIFFLHKDKLTLILIFPRK